jgi:uncharacterized membrane protein
MSTEKEKAAQRYRRTFIAGLFAFLPMAVTAFILWWVDDKTKVLTEWFFHRRIPFVGVLLTLFAIYVTGMITTSILGKWMLTLLDAVLMRLPGIRLLYQGWKQIALTPGGTEGTFSRVVLIPDESGTMKLLGFTSGRLVEIDGPHYCIFVPSSPNPITGRLYFIKAERCQFIEMTPEEAIKVVLSTGNYLPPMSLQGAEVVVEVETMTVKQMRSA